MKKLNKENIRLIKVAVLVLTAIFSLIYGITFLDGSVFTEKNEYTVYYELAEGVKQYTPVNIKGVPVGSVTKVGLDPETLDVKVTLSINSNIKIRESSIALLEKSLISAAAISIIFPEDSETKGFLLPGSVITGKIDEGLAGISEEVKPFMSQSEHLIQDIDKTVNNVNDVFTDKNKSNISRIFSQLSVLTYRLNGIAKFIQSERPSISKTIHNTEALTKDMQSMSKNVDRLAIKINELLSAKGTLNKLIHDETAYQNMNKVMTDLSELLSDIKEKPKKYVHFSLFGRKK